LILGAAYTLWMIKRVVFGEVANQHVAQLKDLNCREATVLTVLAFLVLLFGIWPKPLVEVTQTTTKTLLAQISQPKYALYADLNTALN
ncbi:MAG TPA: hypothetical protein PLD88_08020, partial [Candidatus Berkiella sp.]|nr:hypothetical protein [Candidatus Berkiella sp.]